MVIRFYNYKINWVFHRTEILNKLKEFKVLFSLINIRSLDTLNFLDDDFNILNNYNGFIMYSNDSTRPFKEIIKILKSNDKIKYLELLKK